VFEKFVVDGQDTLAQLKPVSHDDLPFWWKKWLSNYRTRCWK
jgi:hypothetical protein